MAKRSPLAMSDTMRRRQESSCRVDRARASWRYVAGVLVLVLLGAAGIGRRAPGLSAQDSGERGFSASQGLAVGSDAAPQRVSTGLLSHGTSVPRADVPVLPGPTPAGFAAYAVVVPCVTVPAHVGAPELACGYDATAPPLS